MEQAPGRYSCFQGHPGPQPTETGSVHHLKATCGVLLGRLGWAQVSAASGPPEGRAERLEGPHGERSELPQITCHQTWQVTLLRQHSSSF